LTVPVSIGLLLYMDSLEVQINNNNNNQRSDNKYDKNNKTMQNKYAGVVHYAMPLSLYITKETGPGSLF